MYVYVRIVKFSVWCNVRQQFTKIRHPSGMRMLLTYTYTHIKGGKIFNSHHLLLVPPPSIFFFFIPLCLQQTFVCVHVYLLLSLCFSQQLDFDVNELYECMDHICREMCNWFKYVSPYYIYVCVYVYVCKFEYEFIYRVSK